MITKQLKVSSDMGIGLERAKRKSGWLFQKNNSAKKLTFTKNLSVLIDEKSLYLEKYVPSSDLN